MSHNPNVPSYSDFATSLVITGMNQSYTGSPLSAPTVGTSGTATTIATGTYYAVYTRIGQWGAQSTPSAASVGQAITNGGANLTATVGALNDAYTNGVTAANIYVGTASTGPFYYQGQITNVAGGTLTLTSVTLSGSQPPTTNLNLAISAGTVFIAPNGRFHWPGGLATIPASLANYSLDWDGNVFTTSNSSLAAGRVRLINGALNSNGTNITGASDYRPLAGFAQRNQYNIKDYGAMGDGVTDDTSAINSAISTANTNGGGTVFFPPGTYMVSGHAHPVNGTYVACLVLYNKVKLLGSGRDSTIIKAVAGSASGTQLLLNYNISAGGDEDMVIEDITFDGNAANQGSIGVLQGIVLIRTRGVRFNRVRVKDIVGTTLSGTTEGFAYETQLGDDTYYTDCEAIATATNGVSAFSADSATNVRYVNCTSFGSSMGQGFTHNTVSSVTYINCASYSNSNYGFNSEVSQDISYVNCIAGQYTANAGGYPYSTANTKLNNGTMQMVINGSTEVSVSGCHIVGCTLKPGLQIAGTCNKVSLVGNVFRDCNAYAITSDTGSINNGIYSHGNIFIGNTNDMNLTINGSSQNVSARGNVISPTTAGSGVAVNNPYPTTATVYIKKSDTSLSSIAIGPIGGTQVDPLVATGLSYYAMRVPAGFSIAIYYTGTIYSWTWWLE